MRSLFKINFFTYVFLILSMLSGYMREMFLVFLILVIHEMGHFILMKLYSISVSSITIFPYGGLIKSDMFINTDSKKVLIIGLGGIFIQLILWVLFFLFYKLDLISYNFYNIFFDYNTCIMLFNLIPIYPLDGYKILNSLFELFLSFKNSTILSLIISIVSLIIFIIYLYVFKISNYIIVLFLLISIISYIKQLNYLFNKFYIERVLYDFSYSGLVSVDNISKMYKNKYNYIGSMDEKKYLSRIFNN